MPRPGSPLHKTVVVVSTLASLVVVVLSVLQMVEAWEDGFYITIPLMGVVMLCQAYIQWNSSRRVSYISIASAALIFLCAILLFIIR